MADPRTPRLRAPRPCRGPCCADETPPSPDSSPPQTTGGNPASPASTSSPASPGPRGPGVFQPRPGHLQDRRRSRPYAFHGLTAMQRALKQFALDEQTALGRALMAWRRDLIRDLGGDEVVTTQQLAVIDVAIRTKLLLDSVDDWLLRQPSLVLYRTRSLFPVVSQRQSIANGLVHYMNLLGLERRTIPPKTLDSYLRERYRGESKTEETPSSDEAPSGDPP
jgi:hypothetical protein